MQTFLWRRFLALVITVYQRVRIGYDKLSFSIKDILEKNGCNPSEYMIDFLKQCFVINGILPTIQKIKYFLKRNKDILRIK